MRPDSLGVIGLGAIGGSLAWQAARAGVRRVVGLSADPKDAAQALRAGALTELARTPTELVKRVELVVLATPPAATLDLLDEIGATVRERGVYVTDVTSVKVAVVACAERLALAQWFAGSHPFAGTHRPGFAGAAPDRFTDCVVYVTPLPGGDRAADEVTDFWARVLGAHPVRLDAARHDAMLARTSHLPQAVASALAVTLAAQEPGGRCGTGALSTTRLAAGSPELWTDVLLLNREPLLEALAEFGESVATLRIALERRDATQVRAWLAQGAGWRRQFSP